MKREVLPARRQCETLAFRAGNIAYTATIGFFDDGRVGEIFLNGGKIASETDVVARDSAVVLSIALQHGVELDAIRSSLTRRGDGTPEGPMGILLDLLANRSAPFPHLVVAADKSPPTAPLIPVDRGFRYLIELNSKERSLIPEDVQSIYTWNGILMKWIMQLEHRATFARESEK